MEMRFSSLIEHLGGTKNPLYLQLEEKKSTDAPVVDLVKGNVNEHGIVFPEDTLRDILSEAIAAARVYRPDSFGQPVAREAVARYYGLARIRPENVLITPGTSVSYWYCFKLLAEPGDEVLIPQPSYPLFDYIARLCGVDLTPYRLVESRSWAIDLDHLENQISTRTRAIVLISPHNPTGMIADDDQLAGLAEIASRHILPIISDEVFSEFLFGMDRLPRPVNTAAPLVFTLNGFSKMFALPGMKLGWMTVSGDASLVKKSMSALEMISDTFLPVNELMQFAMPQIFTRGQAFKQNYVRWVRECFDRAMNGLADVEFVRPQGGFYITLPIYEDEEKAAVDLLKEHGILTHPGYYYDIRPNHLVMTFIYESAKLTKLFRRIGLVTKLA